MQQHRGNVFFVQVAAGTDISSASCLTIKVTASDGGHQVDITAEDFNLNDSEYEDRITSVYVSSQV